MATPKDNTEIVNMFRDVKNCIWNSITPMKIGDRHFASSLSNFRYPSLLSENCSFNPRSVSTKLNFSELDDSNVFLDSPSLKTDESPESLKRKLICTEVELQTSKAQIKERESFISMMEPTSKKLCFSLENRLEESRKQNEFDADKIVELEAKLNWAKHQVVASKSQANDVERYKIKELEQQEQKIFHLQEECSNWKIEIANVKSEKLEAIRKSNDEIGRLNMKIADLCEEAEKAQALIKNLNKQISDMEEKSSKHDFFKNELFLAQEKINSLDNKIESDKEAALIVASRQNDLKLLSEMQKEYHTLKEESIKCKENNIFLYHEKLWNMQEKLNQAEKRCTDLAKLQAENEQLTAKVDQWEELLDKKSSFRSPMAFSRKLSEYQQNEALITNKLSQVVAENKTLEKQKKEHADMISNLNHKLKQTQMNISLQENLIKRMQRKIIFLTKAKDHTQKLLDSYLSESTLVGVSTNAEHTRLIEETNQEYKKELEKSEKEIEDLIAKLVSLSKDSSPGSGLKLKKLQKENGDLATKILSLQKENRDLKDKCSQQDFSPKESAKPEKILHLRFNPLDTANQRHLEIFGKMQVENDKLKKRIKVLEEEGTEAQNVTLKVRQKLESEGADSTLQALKEQLAAAERKQRFILDNARIKSVEFREAIYRLTGFRFDAPASETYKVSHLYSDSRDDYLMFKVNSKGIQLIETDYSNQLHERMELYLQQYDSFPAFLASLSLDLFNQQTFVAHQ